MTRHTPRWYQQEAVEAISDVIFLDKPVSPVAAIATGGGKSLVNAMLFERIVQYRPDARVMSLAPSMELIKQNAEEAFAYLSAALSAKIGIYCAGLNMRERLSQFTIGTPQSVSRQIQRFPRADFVIVDEAHVFSPEKKTAKRIIENIRAQNPDARFIGLTATPFTMKGVRPVPLTQCGLFDLKAFDATTGKNFNRLVREGSLATLVAPSVRFPQIDVSNIKTKDGDFDERTLAIEAMKVTHECVAVALQEAKERKHFMWFAVNIAHARMIYESLCTLGESAVIIHGELDKKERVTGVEEYLNKAHRHIVSVAMLTTGFNAPFVDCVVILRPTRSLLLFRQIVGRGLRPYTGKENTLCLDAGGNFSRHGPINADLDAGDSRSGLWECTESTIVAPGVKETLAQREASAIRFRVNSDKHRELDLRNVLNLAPSAPACGYWNDTEHLSCRQCGRWRQGYLHPRIQREIDRSDGIGSGYDIHDEGSVVLKDERCREVRTLSVLAQRVEPFGSSELKFTFETEFGEFGLSLDFERNAGNNKFYAFSRKYFEKATGRKIPNEAYRVLLQRETLLKPLDITLTKYEDGAVFLTEIRFNHADRIETFRYDPKF